MEDEVEGRTSEYEHDIDDFDVMDEKNERTYDNDGSCHSSDEEVEVKPVSHMLCKSAELLPFRGGQPWQGEQEDKTPSPD